MADVTAGFDKEARELVVEMASLGWTFRRTTKGHVIGTSPNGKDTMTVSAKMSLSNRTRNNQRAAWERWKRANISLGTETEAKALVETLRAANQAGAEVDEIAEAVLTRAAIKHSEQTVASQRRDQTSVTLVEEKPWLARKGGTKRGTGRLYESKAVLERRWSNGLVDYVCAFEGCDWHNEDPVSVARHYGGTHGSEHPSAQRTPPTVEVDEYVPTDRHNYRPSDRLVSALLAALVNDDGRLRPEWVGDPRGLAEAALCWFHERPDLGDAESLPRVPLTDAQIVERVRALVGQPFAAEVESLNVMVAQSQELLASVREENERLRARLADLRALADMLREEVDTD